MRIEENLSRIKVDPISKLKDSPHEFERNLKECFSEKAKKGKVGQEKANLFDDSFLPEDGGGK